MFVAMNSVKIKSDISHEWKKMNLLVFWNKKGVVIATPF